MYVQGDAARALALNTEMLTLARAVDSGRMIGVAFLYRVLIAIGPHGSPREREQLRGELDEPVARLRAVGFHRGLALLLAGRARLLVDVDAPAALAALREALQLARGRDDPLAISFVPWLAVVLLVERLPAEQVARLSGGVAAWRRARRPSAAARISTSSAPPRTEPCWCRRSPRRERRWGGRLRGSRGRRSRPLLR